MIQFFRLFTISKIEIILDHPALAIPINDVMERVGIDLVLGLPLTDDGYNGVLVITEYLSKFAYAVPIKSKSASGNCSPSLALFLSVWTS